MSKRFRFLLIVVLIVFGALSMYPTIDWYFFVPADMKVLAGASRHEVREYARLEARGALDALRTAAAANEPVPAHYAFIADTARANLRELGERPARDLSAVDVLRSFRDEREAFNAFEAHYRNVVMDLKNQKNRIILLGLDLSGGMSVTLEANGASLATRLGREPRAEEMSEAVDLAMEIIRNRIDRFGVTEPQIRRQGDERIVIEIPGDNDRERVNSFLLGKGSLAFHIVDDEATGGLMQLQATRAGWDPAIDGTPDFVMAGSSVREYVTRDEYGIDQHVRWISIYDDVSQFGLDGAHITEAQVARDPLTNQPTVNFVLDREGADIFAKLTRDNVGSSLAIVMDDKVRAYARIQEEIPTGQVRITGFDVDQAAAIALVLRTAALPVDLEVVNQQAIGAQLGQTAIQTGLQAIAVGFALVIVFMIVYYKGAGIIANLALLLNLFFIVAILSAFNLTLTLTSIAGIILTVGMAVDANVIIFERIKEEYRLGKGAQAAVHSGFDKAFWTVMDANITTFIAALFLSQLGTGPIQGFAVSLAVGIVSSMFTALFVTRLVFDFNVDVLKRTKLSIAWRLA